MNAVVQRRIEVRIEVNGVHATTVHLETRSGELVLEFHSARNTFRLECTICGVLKETGASAPLTATGFSTSDNASLLSKHLRRPTAVSSTTNAFRHAFALDHLSTDLSHIVLSVTLPSRTALYRAHAVSLPEQETVKRYDSAEQHTTGALPDFDYLIYTTAASFDNDYLPLRSHYVAQTLASSGLRVAYVPSAKCDVTREVAPRLHQFDASQLKDLVARLGQQRVPGCVIISSKPDVHAINIAQTLALHDWTTVYEVRDDMQAMNRKGFSQYFAPEFEKFLAVHADAVFCVSEPIAWKMEALGARRVFVSPNGVEEALVDRSPLERRFLSPRENRIVYFGHMFPERFDVELVHTLSMRFPEHRLELYGVGLPPDEFKSRPNVSMHGYTTIDAFVAAAERADIGILPFREGPLTFALSPLKYPQYLCAGLKVVSADVFQLRGKPLCFNDPSLSFVENLSAAAAHQTSPSDVASIRQYLEDSRWTRAMSEFVATVEGIRRERR